VQSNNLFFADYGNNHSNDSSIIQKILDISHNWEVDFGMKFAAEKCLVLSKQKNLALKIGDNMLPHMEEATYLGIPLSEKGFDSKSLQKIAREKWKLQ